MATEVIVRTVQLGFTLMDSVDVCRVLLDNSTTVLVACVHHVQMVKRLMGRAVHVHRVQRVNRRRRVVHVRHVQLVK